MAINVFSVLLLLISLKNVIQYLWLEIEMEKIRRNLSRGQNTGRFGVIIRFMRFQMQDTPSRWDTLPEAGKLNGPGDPARIMLFWLGMNRLPFIRALVSCRLCDMLLLSLQERAYSESAVSRVSSPPPESFCSGRSWQDEPGKAFRKEAVGGPVVERGSRLNLC